MTTHQPELPAPIIHGLRKRGEEAIIGIVPNAIHAIVPTAGPFVEKYEEVPLYTAEQVAATHAASRPADGEWVMVPREPTPDMLRPFASLALAARGEDPDEPMPPHGEYPRWYAACGPFDAAYRAMLASAPTSAQSADPLCPKHGHMYAAGCADCSADIDMLTKADPTPDAAARARELFGAMLAAPYGDTTMGDIVCAETTRNRLESAWLPIIERALTTPSDAGGDSEPFGYFDPDVIDHMQNSLIDPVGVIRRKPNGVSTVPIYLTPPNPGDARLRELVHKWRTGASLCTRQDYGDGARDALNECADELLSLLDGKGVSHG